jgi:probable rRNA maturation factor
MRQGCTPPSVAGRERTVIEVEVFGAALAPDAPSGAEIERLCLAAAAAVGVDDGHLAIEYVDAERIAALNAEHRGRPEPTIVHGVLHLVGFDHETDDGEMLALQARLLGGT